MADLKEFGINTKFDRKFFYECIEGICKEFIESHKNFKEDSKIYEVELLYYIGELKRATQMFEEEGQKEDTELKEYYKHRKEHYGY